MNNTENQVLLEKIRSIQENLDLHIKDTDKEIGDMQNLRMEVAGLRETVNELRKSMDRHADKVTNRFAQAMEPVIEETQSLQKAIKNKTIIKTKESFWEFIKQKLKGG